MPDTRPRRLPLAFYAGLQARYVAPYGDDANDGYDWRYPKQTILAAYDSLSVGGFIYIMDRSHVGGEVQGQGIWMTGVPYNVPGSPLYPGWRLAKNVQFIGVGPVQQDSEGLFSYPMARILPGRPEDTERPDPAFDALIWLTGNGSNSMVFQNLFLFDTSIGFRFAVDGNPEEDPFDPAQRMSNPNTVAGVYVNQCCVQNNGGMPDGGPAVDMGYVLFMYFEQCSFNRPNDIDMHSDKRAAILSKAGDASSMFKVINCRGAHGGVKYYVNATTYSLHVDDYIVESDGSDLPPAVWIIDGGPTGEVFIRNVQTADYGPGSDPAIRIDASDAIGDSSQVVIFGTAGTSAIATKGAVVIGAGHDGVFFVNDFHSSNKSGFVAGKIWGDADHGRFQAAMQSARLWNMIPQREDDGGITGPILDQPAAPSGNCVWTSQGAVSPGVNSPIADRHGGTTGWQVGSSNGSVASNKIFAARNYSVAAGDNYVVGMWARSSVGGMPTVGNIMSAQLLGSSGQPDPTCAYTNADVSGGSVYPVMAGDGEWQWIACRINVTSLNGGDGTVSLNVTCWGTQAKPIQFCDAIVYRLPIASYSDNEAELIRQEMGSHAQMYPGIMAPQRGQMIGTVGGVAVDGLVAPVALAATTKLMKIYDAVTGALVGYVEVKPAS